MERETGFEPATSSLARKCSTTELLPHRSLPMTAGAPECRGPESKLATPAFFSAVLYLLSYLGTILSYVAAFRSVKEDGAAKPLQSALPEGVSGPRRALTEYIRYCSVKPYCGRAFCASALPLKWEGVMASTNGKRARREETRRRAARGRQRRPQYGHPIRQRPLPRL